MWRCILLICGISCGYRTVLVRANTIPTAVQLGGAIVAAVEEDVEQEEEQHRRMDLQRMQLWHNLSHNSDVEALERLLSEIGEGRGKFHKRRKMLKYLYPLLVGVLIAKTFLIPLILKMLTALSTSSFVMSKIALVTSGLLVLKWIFGGAGGSYDAAQERTHLEILHLPPIKAYHHGEGVVSSGGGGGGAAGWNDLSLGGSSLYESKLKSSKYRSKYIPVAGGSEAAARDPVLGIGVGTSSLYRHPHHSYKGAYDGTPFL